MTTPHPAFAAAPEGNRWTGSLAELFAELKREALQGHGRWCWRVLPRGAVVAMRMTDDFPRRQLRLSRRERPEGEAALKAWSVEVQTFLRAFGATGWEPAVAESETGVVALFIETYPGETRVGRTTCADCRAEIAYEKAFPINRCATCALKAGQRAKAQGSLL